LNEGCVPGRCSLLFRQRKMKMDPCPEAANSCRSFKAKRLDTGAKIIVTVINIQRRRSP
jgi:hypothetical protein